MTDDELLAHLSGERLDVSVRDMIRHRRYAAERLKECLDEIATLHELARRQADYTAKLEAEVERLVGK